MRNVGRMKRTHREDVFCWSRFDEARNMDFNSWAWARSGEVVLIDPLPLSEHDRRELEALGRVTHVVITNSDHLREAPALVARYAAKLFVPNAERAFEGFAGAQSVADGNAIVPGLVAIELDGSKTPGELALLLETTTLVSGDLLRAPHGGGLAVLPDAKLQDPAKARDSVRRLADLVEDVGVTGRLSRSASSRISAAAPELTTPPPM
jgi:glyoxylase-like metal-dependent hydrolase (beta-lactamase superfamily II)